MASALPPYPPPAPPLCAGCWPQRTGQAIGLGYRLRSVFPVSSSGWELPADPLLLWLPVEEPMEASLGRVAAACVHIHVHG